MSEKKEKIELNNDELKKVSGGKYSSCTYMDLGMSSGSAIQDPYNHPLITTSMNSCDMGGGAYCKDCGYRGERISLFSCYCLARSLEYDPCK